MVAKKSVNKKSIQGEIWVEGKTDWKILQKALKSLGPEVDLRFHQTLKDMGSKQLLSHLKSFAEKENPIPLIFIFDRDEENIIKEVCGSKGDYKDWGNNIYSFTIPIPDHRKDHKHVCIELYFTDDVLRRSDVNGRHLFFSLDFHKNSGKHKNDPTIHYARVGYLKDCSDITNFKIIDSEVYNAQNENIALSKSDFAEYISKSTSPFDNLNFNEFQKILDVVQEIIKSSQTEHDFFYPNLEDYFISIESDEKSGQFSKVFNLLKHVIALALQIFVISTIRVYEEQIINEPPIYKKKVIPIKKIITEAFRQPSLTTLQKLAVKCYYLIDDKAPDTLLKMKGCLNETIVLEEIGQLWDDLETLFYKDYDRPRIVSKTSIRREFLLKIIPEIAEFASKPQEVFDQIICGVIEYENIQLSDWQRALIKIANILNPIFSNPFVFRSIVNLDPATDEYIVEVKKFRDGQLYQSLEKIQRLMEDYERKSSELILADSSSVQIYPLLLIREDALFYYKRTLTSGYEYFSPVLDKIFVEQTKRKFNHSLFQVGSKQELFWTDVLPRENPKNNIRANIPDEGPYEFIGRRKQINQIKEEIINIINENGIVYGPGGIGKTALMIQLSKELYEEKDLKNIQYNNIIWVSAKYNFYDYIHDAIEEREPQVRSLDSILFAILKFFELENLEEYSFEDRKEFTLELLKDYQVLLIVDNFETIAKGEQDRIIKFFGTQVKVELRHKPENFKIILTSRELIPSGFKQIELTGLDIRESKRLIESLYKRYRSSSSELTNNQKEALYERTKGIPILIKHFLARIYEYKVPFDTVIRELPSYSGNIVQFSFREILDQLSTETNSVALQLLILFELVDIPLMIRQIADILEIDEIKIEGSIPQLSNFECIKRINQDNQEKYILNDEIRLLTKSLTQKYGDLSKEIRKKYYRNFSFDKRLDYTSEEEEVIGIFEGYVKNRQYADAEDFIKRELKKHPNSVLLNYYYALYLKDRRNEIGQAIKILEDLRKISRNHPTVLKLLFTCYATESIPKFESADNLADQIQADLEEYLDQDLELKMEISRFYIRWSISIKMSKGGDPYEENLRIARYKELADKALNILIPIERQLNQMPTSKEMLDISTHDVYYRMSQCYYNKWEYDEALRLIAKAISLAPKTHRLVVIEYESFQDNIQKTKTFYDKNPWLDKR